MDIRFHESLRLAMRFFWLVSEGWRLKLLSDLTTTRSWCMPSSIETREGCGVRKRQCQRSSLGTVVHHIVYYLASMPVLQCNVQSSCPQNPQSTGSVSIYPISHELHRPILDLTSDINYQSPAKTQTLSLSRALYKALLPPLHAASRSRLAPLADTG